MSAKKKPVRRAKKAVRKKSVRKAKRAVRRTKRVVRRAKRATRKPKRVVRKAKRVVRKAKRVMRKTKRGVRKRKDGGRRGRALQLVRRPARKRRTAPPPAFPQTSGATAKQRLLFDLVRSHTSVLASIQGLLDPSANRPLAEGKWTVRETVLHLVTRDRIRLREMERALLGIAPSWRSIDEAEQSEINARDLAALNHIGWDETVRLFRATRRELMEAIESVPEDPADVWAEDHPFGWMMLRLPAHDRHHADAIKRSRS
jgi:DinB superfamily